MRIHVFFPNREILSTLQFIFYENILSRRMINIALTGKSEMRVIYREKHSRHCRDKYVESSFAHNSSENESRAKCFAIPEHHFNTEGCTVRTQRQLPGVLKRCRTFRNAVFTSYLVRRRDPKRVLVEF